MRCYCSLLWSTHCSRPLIELSPRSYKSQILSEKEDSSPVPSIFQSINECLWFRVNRLPLISILAFSSNNQCAYAHYASSKRENFRGLENIISWIGKSTSSTEMGNHGFKFSSADPGGCMFSTQLVACGWSGVSLSSCQTSCSNFEIASPRLTITLPHRLKSFICLCSSYNVAILYLWGRLRNPLIRFFDMPVMRGGLLWELL